MTLAVSVAYFIPRPAGLALLPGNRDRESSARWFVQAGGGKGDAAAFRFLEERIPADATVALDLVRNTYLYPAWDARLRRTVRFVPRRRRRSPRTPTWLVVGPSRTVDASRLEDAGWKLELVVAATVADLRALGCGHMCRNIKTLHNFEPPATEDEVRAAALQYVRKVSGSQKPSKANEAAFARAVDEVADVDEPSARRARDRARRPVTASVEAARARARAEKRFGQAAPRPRRASSRR